MMSETGNAWSVQETGNVWSVQYLLRQKRVFKRCQPSLRVRQCSREQLFHKKNAVINEIWDPALWQLTRVKSRKIVKGLRLCKYLSHITVAIVKRLGLSRDEALNEYSYETK